MSNATKPQPVTETDTDAGRRARFIATLHGLIAWLTAHPDVPVPWSSGMNVRVPDRATLESLLAELPGAVLCPSGNQITIFDPLGSTEFYTPISIAVKEESRPL